MENKRKDCLFVDLDFADFKVTKEMRKKAMSNLNLPVRQRMGMFRTDEEREKYISKSLKRKLP